MHELALVQSLVEAVEETVEQAGDSRVHVVRLDVGKLTCVVPEALRFSFAACVPGTVLEGAVLEIVEVPGRFTCRGCGVTQISTDRAALLCCVDCGSIDIALEAGRELRVRELEVS